MAGETFMLEDYSKALIKEKQAAEKELIVTDSIAKVQAVVIIDQKARLNLKDSTIAAQGSLTAIERKKRNKSRKVAAASIILNVVLIAIIL